MLSNGLFTVYNGLFIAYIMLGAAWYKLIVLSRELKKGCLDYENEEMPAASRAWSKNRLSRVWGWMRLGHNLVGSEESPTTDVVKKYYECDFNEQVAGIPKDPYGGDVYPKPEPIDVPSYGPFPGFEYQPGPGALYQEQAIEAAWKVWVKDHDVAIKHLEEQVAALNKGPKELPVILTTLTRLGDRVYKVEHSFDVAEMKVRVDNLETNAVTVGKNFIDRHIAAEKLIDSLEENLIKTAKHISEILGLLEQVADRLDDSDLHIRDLEDKFHQVKLYLVRKFGEENDG